MGAAEAVALVGLLVAVAAAAVGFPVVQRARARSREINRQIEELNRRVERVERLERMVPLERAAAELRQGLVQGTVSAATAARLEAVLGELRSALLSGEGEG